MTFTEDYFKRAARRFLAEVEAENRSAADEQVTEDGNKEKAGAVIELEPVGLGGDRLREAVDLLEVVESGEDMAEHVREEEGPEKEVVTILVDGQAREVTVLPNGGKAIEC